VSHSRPLICRPVAYQHRWRAPFSGGCVDWQTGRRMWPVHTRNPVWMLSPTLLSKTRFHISVLPVGMSCCSARSRRGRRQRHRSEALLHPLVPNQAPAVAQLRHHESMTRSGSRSCPSRHRIVRGRGVRACVCLCVRVCACVCMCVCSWTGTRERAHALASTRTHARTHTCPYMQAHPHTGHARQHAPHCTPAQPYAQAHVRTPRACGRPTASSPSTTRSGSRSCPSRHRIGCVSVCV